MGLYRNYTCGGGGGQRGIYVVDNYEVLVHTTVVLFWYTFSNSVIVYTKFVV